MTPTDLKAQPQAELPELLKQDASFRHWLEQLIRQTAVTPESFDRMLQEFAADRVEQRQRWDEQNRGSVLDVDTKIFKNLILLTLYQFHVHVWSTTHYRVRADVRPITEWPRRLSSAPAIVRYNGGRRWTAPTDLEALIKPGPGVAAASRRPVQRRPQIAVRNALRTDALPTKTFKFTPE